MTESLYAALALSEMTDYHVHILTVYVFTHFSSEITWSMHLLSYLLLYVTDKISRGKNSINLRLELCGSVKQEVEEAASFDKVTAKYDLQNRSNYTGNSF